MKTPLYTLLFLLLSSLSWLSSCGPSALDMSITENIDHVMELLYLNKIEDADSILAGMDTLQFKDQQLAKFQLANGFLDFSNGNVENATKLFDASSAYINRKGSRKEKAEVFLLNGFIFERALLIAEAAKKYSEALEIYREYRDCDQYFYALLGAIRTLPVSDIILKETEQYVERNPSDRNQVLLLNAKADLSNDPEQRQKWTLAALKHFDEDYDVKKHVQLLSKIARNYQDMHKSDSAINYINKAEKLIGDHGIKPKRILHYYLTKAYIDRKNNNDSAALKSIQIVMEHGGDQKGILGYAHQQKSYTLSSLGEHAAANEDLMQYTKYLKGEFSDNQKNQIGLLSVQLNMVYKELGIANVKKKWMGISILMLLAGVATWIFFHFYIKAKNRKERRLTLELKQSNNKYVEQLTNNLDLVEEKWANGFSSTKERDIQRLKNLKYKTILKVSHPQFMNKIKALYPGLTPKDLIHSVCILDDFTVAQTADIMEVSDSMIKKARQKLRKIFNCTTTEELTRLLNQIEDTPLEDLARTGPTWGKRN